MGNGRALLLPVLLLAGALYAFSDVLPADRQLYFRDHNDVFRPRWAAVQQSFQHGELPALTRVTRGGVPFERNLNATYTPLTAIVLFGDIDVTYDLLVFAHLLLLAAGIFVFARELGASREEAFAAAAVGALSGPMLSWDNLFIALQALSYAPWMGWAVLRIMKQPTAARAGIAAIAVGCHLQGIMPELVLLDVLGFLLIAYAVRPKVDLRLASALISAGVLGVLLASVVLMPVVENLPYTNRGAGFDYAEASRWSLHPWALLELIVPAFWAPPDLPFGYVQPVLGPETSALMSSLYVGPALAIASVAFADPKHRRWALIFAALSLFAVLVAMGEHLPIHRGLVQLPVLKNARFPVKYMVLALAFFVPLVVLGVRAAASHPKWLLIATILQASVVGTIARVVYSDELAAYVQDHLPAHIPLNVGGIDRSGFGELLIASMRAHVLHSLMFALLILLIAAALLRRSRSPAIAQLMLASVLLADLASAGPSAILGAPVEPKGPPSSIVEKIRAPFHRLVRVSTGRAEPPIRALPGESIAASQFVSERQRGLYLYDDLPRVDDHNDDAASNPRSVLVLQLLNGLPAEAALRLFARAGASWISTPSQRTGDDLVAEIEGEPPQYFSPVPSVRPIAKSYARWRALDTASLDTATLQRLYTSPDTFDVALISGELPAVESSTDAASCEGEAKTAVSPESRFGDVTVLVEAPCATVVSVLHTRMRGWRVTVDDREVAPLEVDFGWLAALAPAGTHTVRFEYVPRANDWAKVSLAAFIAVLALFVYGAIARRAR